MSVDDAQAAFYQIYNAVFKDENGSPETRASRLEDEIYAIMDAQKIPRTARLLDASAGKLCKVYAYMNFQRPRFDRIPHSALCYSPADHLGLCNMFRNYRLPDKVTPNITIVEALRAAWATPGLVTPVFIGPEGGGGYAVSAVNGFANPIQQIIKEIYNVCGKESRISCLLSLGSGYRGVISLRDEGTAMHIGTQMTMDCEAVADEVYRRLESLGVYHRLSVDHGLEGWNRFGVDLGSIKSHVDAYLSKKENNNKMDRCISTSVTNTAVTSEQLCKPSVHSLRASLILPQDGCQAQGVRSDHGLPPLSAYFLPRKKPMEAMIRGLIEADASTQRIMVISGLGGSGKTQLSLKFARDFGEKYVSYHIIIHHAHFFAAIDTSSSLMLVQRKVFVKALSLGCIL